MTIIRLATTMNELADLANRHESLWWNTTRIRWKAERPSSDSWCLITAEKARELLAARQEPDDVEQELIIAILTPESRNAHQIWNNQDIDAIAVIGTSLEGHPQELTFGPVYALGRRDELWIRLSMRATSEGWDIMSQIDVTYREWENVTIALDVIAKPFTYFPILSDV